MNQRLRPTFHRPATSRRRWDSRDRVHVLLSLDTERTDLEGAAPRAAVRKGGDYPQSWTRNWGQGRVFYTSLGHLPETWTVTDLVGHHERERGHLACIGLKRVGLQSVIEYILGQEDARP